MKGRVKVDHRTAGPSLATTFDEGHSWSEHNDQGSWHKDACRRSHTEFRTICKGDRGSCSKSAKQEPDIPAVFMIALRIEGEVASKVVFRRVTQPCSECSEQVSLLVIVHYFAYKHRIWQSHGTI